MFIFIIKDKITWKIGSENSTLPFKIFISINPHFFHLFGKPILILFFLHFLLNKFWYVFSSYFFWKLFHSRIIIVIGFAIFFPSLDSFLGFHWVFSYFLNLIYGLPNLKTIKIKQLHIESQIHENIFLRCNITENFEHNMILFVGIEM